MKINKVDITPDTKVSELLRDYPELEYKLQQFSSAFAALKNPVLRRTVAKVTSLQQAAKVGGVSIIEMVDALRKEAGLSILKDIELNGNIDFINNDTFIKPNLPITLSLDVRPIIDAGDHPKDAVLDMAKQLKYNECMELLSPFPPIPLIEALHKRGFKTTMLLAVDGVVATYIER